MKRKYLTFANALSISRLVLLPVLYGFVLMGMEVAFTISFIILGSTDFFDGKVARRFNQVTEIGKTLDSVADLFFYLSCAWFLYELYPDVIMWNFVLLMVFFTFLFLSFVVSTLFCKKPILMHTFLLRAAAVLVYFLIILSYFFDTRYLLTVIVSVYMIAFTEEMFIFVRYGEVDRDTTSFISLLRKEEEE